MLKTLAAFDRLSFYLCYFQKLQEQAQLLQHMQAAAAAAAGEGGGKTAASKLQQQQQQLHTLALQQAHLVQTLQAQQQAALAAGQLIVQQAGIPHMLQGKSDWRSVHTTPQLRCVAALHPTAQKLWC